MCAKRVAYKFQAIRGYDFFSFFFGLNARSEFVFYVSDKDRFDFILIEKFNTFGFLLINITYERFNFLVTCMKTIYCYYS